MNWYVLYTKPKWEKKVAERLINIGLVAYCPQIKKVSQWSDRKKTISVPLFISYVFVQLEEKDRNKVFNVVGVLSYLFWLGKPAIVKENEILAIKEWLSLPDEFEVTIDDWKKGERIILESGPFKSQTAIVEEVKLNQYVLFLESLGCLLKVNKKIVM